MIRVRCPHCSKSLKAPDAMAGKAAACPACRHAMKIPAAPDADADALAAAALAERPEANPPKAVPGPRACAAPAPSPNLPAQAASLPGEMPLGPPLHSPGQVQMPRTPDIPHVPARPRVHRLYLGFVLVLVPLAFSLLSSSDNVEQRLERTLKSLESKPEVLQKLQAESDDSSGGLFELLPDQKIEGAHLSHGTWVHWLYALAAAALFLVAILVLFQPGSATLSQVLTIGTCTATFGILFLISVQWIAEATQGFMMYGRSILVLLFYVVKFIGFSYHAALDPEMGFWVSFFGYTFGVGLCEELTKALPVIVRVRGGSLDWRGACMWGLASGIGFGVAEGILYSSSYYNGISTGGMYLVRFISCAGLHAVWGASAGIMVWRRKAWLESDWDWGDMAATLVWVLGVPMVLHGLYDTLLKKDMNAWALAAALASFAWLVLLIEWTRSQEDDFHATESHRLGSRPYPA